MVNVRSGCELLHGHGRWKAHPSRRLVDRSCCVTIATACWPRACGRQDSIYPGLGYLLACVAFAAGLVPPGAGSPSVVIRSGARNLGATERALLVTPGDDSE